MLTTFDKLMLGGVVTAGVTMGAVLAALARQRWSVPVETYATPTNDAVFGHYNAYSLQTDLKYEPRLYKPGEMQAVVTVHVTDIDGGFAVKEFQIAPWRIALSKGLVRAELVAQLPDPSNLEESARILALLERLHGNAYHEIGSRVLGVVDNYPITLRTSHGDTGNIGPGWALDAGNREVLTPALIEAGRRSLARLIRLVQQATGKQVVVVPHRAWEYPERAEDPGGIVWREIVIPVLAETGAVAGYNTAAGGCPIPISWDPRAQYTDSCKPLPSVA